MTDLPLSQLALLLFMSMGPFGVIVSFDAQTRDRPPAARRRIAVQAFAVALIALALAVFLGRSSMARVGTSQGALVISAGAILVVTAMRSVLFSGSAPAPAPAPSPEALPGWMPAVMPIAVPGMVRPVAVAILILYTLGYPATDQRLAIFAVAASILAMNLIAMLAARSFMARIGMAPLLVLGAVFGVLQVALGVEMLLDGLRIAGVIG